MEAYRPLTRSSWCGLLLLTLAALGCGSSSKPQSSGTASLTVQVAGGVPIAVSVDPVAFLTTNTVTLTMSTQSATVFMSAPRSLIMPSQSVDVGVTGSTMTVWAKTPDVQNPLTATSGTVAIQAFDSSPTGQFTFVIDDATKPTDPSGPSVTIAGTVAGAWQQSN